MSRRATASRPGKPLPAYGRELIELRRRGLVPARGFCNVHALVCLDSWDWGRNHCRLVVGADSDPAGLDFMCIAGLDVLLIVDSRLSTLERRNAAARAILTAGPASLIELDVSLTHRPRYIKTHAVGIELKEFAE